VPKRQPKLRKRKPQPLLRARHLRNYKHRPTSVRKSAASTENNCRDL
jgi:hypothetical protein